jgi:four helix bundle protein
LIAVTATLHVSIWLNPGDFGESGGGTTLAQPAGVAKDHRELDTWKLANEARIEVLRLVERPAFKAHQDLAIDMRRAADSACFNMAEGFARYKPKDHAKFLRIAKGSLNELIDQLYAATLRRLITEEEADRIGSLARRSCGALAKLIRYLENADEP